MKATLNYLLPDRITKQAVLETVMKQSFVDIENVVPFPLDEVFHDNIFLVAREEGVPGFCRCDGRSRCGFLLGLVMGGA